MPSERLDARVGDNETIDLVLKYANMFYEHPEIQALTADDAMKAIIFLNEVIPSGLGLGAASQLGLSVVSGLAANHGIDISSAEAAAISRLSPYDDGVGVGTFDNGGFIISAGDRDLPVTVFRSKFPQNWKIILVTPPVGTGKVYDDDTLSGRIAGLNPGAGAEMSRITLLRLLPGLMKEDLNAFGDALDRMRAVAEAEYAPTPAEFYSLPDAADIISKMRELGAVGAGQSEWGASIYSFADGESAASAIASGLANYFSADGGENGLKIRVISGQNEGSEIKVLRMPL
jgi:beta-RFAP synthase